jgi:hypothetical protein
VARGAWSGAWRVARGAAGVAPLTQHWQKFMRVANVTRRIASCSIRLITSIADTSDPFLPHHHHVEEHPPIRFFGVACFPSSTSALSPANSVSLLRLRHKGNQGRRNPHQCLDRSSSLNTPFESSHTNPGYSRDSCCWCVANRPAQRETDTSQPFCTRQSSGTMANGQSISICRQPPPWTPEFWTPCSLS